MRRLVVLLPLVLLALAVPSAAAQEEAVVRLFLKDQTPVATPEDPFRISVRAVNGTETAYPELSLAITVGSATRSRSAYAQALEAGPSSPLGIKVFPFPGALGPGATRAFRAEWERLAFLSARKESALYPLSVELRSADAPIALFRTALVYLIEAPAAPLNVSASFVLDTPIRLRPDGVLLDDGIEEQVREGGRLEVVVSVLEEASAAVTVGVSPVLLEVLQDMRDGYRVVVGSGVVERLPEFGAAVAARRVLDRLIGVARRTTTTEIVALPYASPSVPTLVESGLQDDLAAQIDRGRAAVASILGVPPSETVFRPPGSTLTAGSLEDLADVLAADGITEALLLDADTLPPPPGLPLTLHGAAPVTAGDATLTAITPDPVVEARKASAPEDPRLRAMWTLGELAAIYFERPSVDRGVALVFGEDEAPPGPFLKVLLRGMEAVPGLRWLRPVKATRVAVGQAPPDDPADPREIQTDSRAPGFSSTVVSGLALAREAVTALASMAEGQPLLDGLRRQLLLAESRYLAGREDLRLNLLRSVRQTVRAEFGKILPPEASSITLTSRSGNIPVTLRNGAGYPVLIQVTLESPPGLRFVGGPSREVRLERPVQQLVFPVRAQSTGRFPVQVELETPDGESIGSSRIAVRSTAYNRVALVITVGAALFLALWWGRRVLFRRTD